jgi:hypothetical protein
MVFFFFCWFLSPKHRYPTLKKQESQRIHTCPDPPDGKGAPLYGQSGDVLT